MATVATLSCIPSVIETGELVRFTTSNSSYPATLWTMQFALNNGIDPPLVVSGSASGTSFIVELTAAQTAALRPGRFTWGEIFTSIATTTEKAYGCSGWVDVLPGIAATTAPTQAQQMVTLLSSALAAFSNKTISSWSGAGQSFTRSNIADYQRQLTYWESRVIAEQARTNSLRGNRAGGSIGVTFARPGSSYGC